MSGYFKHLSSEAHFTNIQREQGLLSDTNNTSSERRSNNMIDFALQLDQLSLEEEILKEFTLFQSKNMDLLQDVSMASPNATSSLRQGRIQGW
ncbi:YGR161W-C [Saccharomyces arboricola H-6]|uniref:YGR161W-C n=1 Tax=Saccharomyces arboricola (strain H-6 / AS 2.3317 / CBS 10644) TaxID=1160507 RepID=J8PN60_SACAR|nr:YGR161W-C [Saccharomyces arboricola H-6]